MTILESLVTYFKTCNYVNKPLKVFKIDKSPINFSIDPFGNQRVIAEDIIGNKTIEFKFYFTVMQKADTKSQEFDTALFFENLIVWIDTQNESRNFPTTDGIKIFTETNPELFSKDPSMSSGIYQIIVSYQFKEEV